MKGNVIIDVKGTKMVYIPCKYMYQFGGRVINGTKILAEIQKNVIKGQRPDEEKRHTKRKLNN